MTIFREESNSSCLPTLHVFFCDSSETSFRRVLNLLISLRLNLVLYRDDFSNSSRDYVALARLDNLAKANVELVILEGSRHKQINSRRVRIFEVTFQNISHSLLKRPLKYFYKQIIYSSTIAKIIIRLLPGVSPGKLERIRRMVNGVIFSTEDSHETTSAGDAFQHSKIEPKNLVRYEKTNSNTYTLVVCAQHCWERKELQSINNQTIVLDAVQRVFSRNDLGILEKSKGLMFYPKSILNLSRDYQSQSQDSKTIWIFGSEVEENQLSYPELAEIQSRNYKIVRFVFSQASFESSISHHSSNWINVSLTSNIIENSRILKAYCEVPSMVFLELGTPLEEEAKLVSRLFQLPLIEVNIGWFLLHWKFQISSFERDRFASINSVISNFTEYSNAELNTSVYKALDLRTADQEFVRRVTIRLEL